MQKDRGKLLTLVLAVMAIGLVMNIYTNINPETVKTVPGMTNPIQVGFWQQILGIISTVIGAGTLIGLWMWKKWAVYLYILGFIISLFTLAYTQRIVFTETARQEIGMATYLFPIALGAFILWVIRRKWQYFE